MCLDKIVNDQNVVFLYESIQVITKMAGNKVNAKLLSGIAVDEMLARYTVYFLSFLNFINVAFLA